jgi:hypothetical protein
MVLTACRVVVFLVGALAFYLSLFLREDQEGKLQNRVEELWAAIDDRQRLTRSRATPFFNKVAATVTRAFDRIFGPKLISVQMIGVSSSCAFAGLFLTVGLVFSVLLHLLRALPSQPTNLPASMGASLSLLSSFFVVVGLVLFIIAALPAIIPSRFSRVVSLLPALLFTWGVIQLARLQLPFHNQLWMLAALLLSMLSDICLLVIVRQSIRWVSGAVHPLRICLVVLAQMTTVVLIVWAPIEISGRVAVRYGWKLLPQFLITIGTFNVFTAIAACAFILTLLAVLLHRIFWPVIERLFYPLARFKVVRNHKAMATLGAICMVFAFPSLRGVVAGILGWLVTVFSGESTTPSKNG